MAELLSQDNFAELLGISEEMSKRAAARKQADEAHKAAVQALIPETVEELVKYACIDIVQRDQVVNILQDHCQTLQLIKKLASKVAAPEAVGQPVEPQTKSAFDNSNRASHHDVLKTPGAIALLEKARNWSRS